MSFRVVVIRTAARRLAEQLPEAVGAACVEFLVGPLADNPHGSVRRCGRRCSVRGARPGAYRVRYRIDEAEQVVHVLDIDHRRDAYRT